MIIFTTSGTKIMWRVTLMAITGVPTNIPSKLGIQSDALKFSPPICTTSYSTIDLIHALNKIPVADKDVHKTPIITPFAHFDFPFMSFGLRNAAQTFQRFMDEVTQDLPFVFAYIDYLLVASANETETLSESDRQRDRESQRETNNICAPNGAL